MSEDCNGDTSTGDEASSTAVPQHMEGVKSKTTEPVPVSSETTECFSSRQPDCEDGETVIENEGTVHSTAGDDNRSGNVTETDSGDPSASKVSDSEMTGNNAQNGAKDEHKHTIENAHDSTEILCGTREEDGTIATQNSNMATNANAIVTHNDDAKSEEEPTITWHDTFKDASELESLVFCVRRPTARSRLFKLVNNLKLLSAKLKRHEEVTDHLENRAKKNSLNRMDDTSSSHEKAGRKRLLNNDNEADDDQPRSKKRRAIPLESMTEALSPQKGIGQSGEGESANVTDEAAAFSPTARRTKLKMPKSYDHMTKPPTLKAKDKWVQCHKKGSNLHCPDFDASNTCPLRSKCPYLHVYNPLLPNPPVEIGGRTICIRYTKEDVNTAYEKYRDTCISKTDNAEKIKNDEMNNPNYSCSMTCPIENIIYYARPFPGDEFVKANKSNQGIWWYRSMKDAREAVSTHVIRDLQNRKIVPKSFMPRELVANVEASKRNAVQKAAQLARKALTCAPSILEKAVAPPVLPDINPWNWMESNYEKRCAQFNTPQGCPLGRACPYAHVYYPTVLNNTKFPDRNALPAAYMTNFQITIEDSFFKGTHGRSPNSPFRVMTAVDNRNQIWYTAALKCPMEGIIYYAAGGSTGMLNKQNMVLYPRVEDAKLAVAGIVLDSFVKRGMSGSRTWTKSNGNTTATTLVPVQQSHNAGRPMSLIPTRSTCTPAPLPAHARYGTLPAQPPAPVQTMTTIARNIPPPPPPPARQQLQPQVLQYPQHLSYMKHNDMIGTTPIYASNASNALINSTSVVNTVPVANNVYQNYNTSQGNPNDVLIVTPRGVYRR